MASVVQALAVVLTGTAGLIGIYFTWRNLKQTRENTEQQLQVAREGQERTQQSTQETLRLTEQGQITERFTRAIDQLGATDDKAGKPKLEIRRGGIHSLEMIADDTRIGGLFASVADVLTAYIRQNTPLTPSKATEQVSSVPKEAGVDIGRVAPLEEPRVDIKAALDVVGRLQRQVEGVRLDLKKINVSRTNLNGVKLSRARLQGANLEGANFEGANLRRADLRMAKLEGVNLEGANLEGADLSEAYPLGPGLTQEQLEQAYGDETTKLPEGLDPPAHWTQGEDKQTEGDR